jgi:hypothetical protein
MRLEAFYLKDHFLFEKPQIINFGGEYIYSISEDGSISRSPNEDYIPNFYAKGKIELLSTLVGKNGAGKTTVLYEIAELLELGDNATKYTWNVAFFNDNNETFVINQNSGLKLNFAFRKNSLPEAKFNFSTIFYSPFLDFKRDIHGINLSFDALVQQDLENLDGLIIANNKADPYRRIKTQNQIRIMRFLRSSLGSEVKKVFNLPDSELYNITTNRPIIETDKKGNTISFHHTPYKFRSYLVSIFDKITTEADNIKGKQDAFDNFANFQKEYYKNYFLMDVFCFFIHKMEGSNTFLEEGEMIEELNVSLDAKDSLFQFLDYHRINKFGSTKQSLPVEETKKLIHLLFSIVDNAKAKSERDEKEFSWGEKRLTISSLKLEELLFFHGVFMNKLDAYFGDIKSGKSATVFQGKRFSDLINVELNRHLSSGEVSLLNLFSRVYTYFDDNHYVVQKKALHENYIFLLDEPDLGFHPEWKRQFVKLILDFIEKLSVKFNFASQVIFTTHDPLTLSDIGNSNVVFVNKINDWSLIETHTDRRTSTFGANIHDLLADSFFMEGGFIGEFAKNKINDLIDFLTNNKESTKGKEDSSTYYYWDEVNAKQLISIIGEPLLKMKLSEMFDTKFNKSFELELLKQRIAQIEKANTDDKTA